MSAPQPELPPHNSHSWFDDAQGFFAGCLMSSLGVALLSAAGLLCGGTAGIATLLHYAFGVGLGPLFVMVNLPFFAFSYRQMGLEFTLKSLAAVVAMGLMLHFQSQFIVINTIAAPYAAVTGAILLGTGILALVRHGGSLGGITIVAIYLQKKYGWRAGRLQMAIDGTITVGALWLLPLPQVLYSILAAVLIGAVLAVNHKPGRYFGW